MHATSVAGETMNARTWPGIILSGIAVLFLLFDTLGKLLKVAPVVEGTAQLGYPESLIQPIGVIQGGQTCDSW